LSKPKRIKSCRAEEEEEEEVVLSEVIRVTVPEDNIKILRDMLEQT
jgi:hypothetical protein